MKIVFETLIVLGYICMSLAFICSLGYGLYLLGVVELTFGKAAWAGFVLWLKMIAGGFLSIAIGTIGVGSLNSKSI